MVQSPCSPILPAASKRDIGPTSTIKHTRQDTAMKNLQDPRPVTLNDVFEYLHTQLNFFANDPADSYFREGYEQALLDMRHDLLGMSPTDRLH
jgi:hypothetical protein